MAILVTGGAGYIGSHTCVELLNAGKEIVVLDNFVNSKPEALKRISDITGKSFKSYEVDLLDRDGVRRVFEQNQIDAVIHFAGLKAVGESCKIPLRYYHNNITGTLILCEVMAGAGCKKIVFSSSATVYGMHNQVPFREDMPLSTTNPYGTTKLFIEQILTDILKAVGESCKIPLRYYHNNITGTLILCEVMAGAGCKKIVFSSSATVYGMHNQVPFREDMPLSTTNPYGTTKLFIEQILTDIQKADPQWSVALLRYFNPIGAHKSGLIGEDPNGIPNNLLPYIAQVATGKLPDLAVYGDDYDTPDGTGVRDYIHVVDLAVGHLKALDYIMNRTGVEAINLGTGKGYSVLDVVHAFERACGKPVKYHIAPRRDGDIATSYADASKAKELLGWSAEHTLDEMCADSWNFSKRNPNGL